MEGNFPLEPSWNNSVGEKGKTRERKRKKRKEKKEEENRSEKLHLLSRIYGDRTVGFSRSKRQSSSTFESFTWVQESGVFAKLREVRFLSYFGYSWSKSHLMAWVFVGP